MEYWDLYDAQARPRGIRVPKHAPLAPNQYHLAVEIWMLDGAGRVLLQQRSRACALLPGLWGLTTGRLVAGETPAQGCARDLEEELGLAVPPEDFRHVRRILRNDGSQLIWDVFFLERRADPAALTLQAEEVERVAWVDRAGFLALLNQGRIFRYPEIEEFLALALGPA